MCHINQKLEISNCINKLSFYFLKKNVNQYLIKKSRKIIFYRKLLYLFVYEVLSLEFL